MRQKAAKKAGGAKSGEKPSPLKRRKSLSKLSQALLHSSNKDLNTLNQPQTARGSSGSMTARPSSTGKNSPNLAMMVPKMAGPGAIIIKLAQEKPFMLVFDDEDTMKKFTDPFEKSCKYCDSVTQRVVEPTSLDYKARKSFADGNNFKHKGTQYQRAFFAKDFLDWVAVEEGVERERAVGIAEGLAEEGVLRPVDGKRSFVPFPDKQVPFRMIWRDYEQRLLILKEISKNLSQFVIHLVGVSSYKPFNSLKKLLTTPSKEKEKEKEKDKEKEKENEERMGLWVKEVNEEVDYLCWMLEKRLAMDILIPGARYHIEKCICWVTYNGSEYYLGSGPEVVELLLDSHLLGESKSAPLKKWLKKNSK